MSENTGEQQKSNKMLWNTGYVIGIMLLSMILGYFTGSFGMFAFIGFMCSLSVCAMNMPIYKKVAYILVFISPGIPLNRLYTGNWEMSTILIRLVPGLGQLYDAYRIWNDELGPDNGWDK